MLGNGFKVSIDLCFGISSIQNNWQTNRKEKLITTKSLKTEFILMKRF